MAKRWRCCGERSSSGGPDGRPLSVRQSDWAARARSSNDESIGSSRACKAPAGGSSFSHKRCATPPNCRTACQPSTVRRNSPVDSLAKSKAIGGADVCDEEVLTDKTVGRTSGAQKTVCSSKAFVGSAAKSQPPFLPEFGRWAVKRICKGAKLLLVGGIATKAFPGKSGHVGAFNS